MMPSVIDITEEAQLAKGTFYLYFQTKEELFLELLEMGFAQWLKTLQQSVSAEIIANPSLLAEAILGPILHDPCFLQLASMTQTILEQNLRAERATAFKIRLGEGIESLAQNLATRYQQSAADLIDLMMDCYAAIIGTWQNTQVTTSMALIKDKVPYPFLFQSFEDRIGPLLRDIITGRLVRLQAQAEARALAASRLGTEKAGR